MKTLDALYETLKDMRPLKEHEKSTCDELILNGHDDHEIKCHFARTIENIFQFDAFLISLKTYLRDARSDFKMVNPC
jgi:hypothetical protein